MKVTGLSRMDMARAVARDITEGMVVNLGIGLPTLVAACIPPDREVLLHSENGILGMGGLAPPGAEDPDLINAGKQHVTLRTGAAIFDHVLSFTLMRGGRLDLSVLGAYQVSASGDLANWSTGDPAMIPAVGGAMDLAVGARRVHVMLQHVAKDGSPRILERCRYPLTGAAVVHRIYTDLAILDVEPEGLLVRGMAPGLTFERLQHLTEAPLRLSPDCYRIEAFGLKDPSFLG